MKWLMNFCKRILSSIWQAVIDIFKNVEAVVILSAAAIGITTILAEIPFHYALPAIIDAPMVIPVISILLISTLVWTMNLRQEV